MHGAANACAHARARIPASLLTPYRRQCSPLIPTHGQVHGAALANAIFLPRGAIVVDVMQKGYYARISWSIRWVRDYKNLQLGYIPLAEQASHLLPPALDSPEYRDLSAEERAQVSGVDLNKLANLDASEPIFAQHEQAQDLTHLHITIY